MLLVLIFPILAHNNVFILSTLISFLLYKGAGLFLKPKVEMEGTWAALGSRASGPSIPAT